MLSLLAIQPDPCYLNGVTAIQPPQQGRRWTKWHSMLDRPSSLCYITWVLERDAFFPLHTSNSEERYHDTRHRES